jgi:hypothetical protein
MPERIDLGRECDHAVEECRDVLGVSSEKITEVRLFSKLLLQSERLRQALSDLALRATDNRRWLALHGSDPNDSGSERQRSRAAGDEPTSETGKNRQVSMELDATDATDAERQE